MSKNMSLNKAMAFAAEKLTAVKVVDSEVSISEATSTVGLRVRRCFAIEGQIEVLFRLDMAPGKPRIKPEVSVNFPAGHKSVVAATAFLALVQELVLVAATLQTQLDELNVAIPS